VPNAAVINTARLIPPRPYATRFCCGMWRANYRIAARKTKIERDAALGRDLSLFVYSARITGHGKYDRPRHFILACRFSGDKPVAIPLMCEIENLGQNVGANVELAFLRGLADVDAHRWHSLPTRSEVPSTPPSRERTGSSGACAFFQRWL
jgi:hypothetical protein